MKIRIATMPNELLIQEWIKIRTDNEHLNLEHLKNFLEEHNWQIPRSFYCEKIMSEELVNRGLFDFAMYDYKQRKRQVKRSLGIKQQQQWSFYYS